MPDQTTRINNAVESTLAAIHEQIEAYDHSNAAYPRADFLHQIRRDIYDLLQRIGIDQTADPAPSAESVGRAMLALPHLAAADVLAVARLIDESRQAEATAWLARINMLTAQHRAELAEHTDRAEKAMSHGEHGEAARWKALFDDRGETIAAWQRHADHLRAELASAIDRLDVMGRWQPEDVRILTDRLNEQDSTIRAYIDQIDAWKRHTEHLQNELRQAQGQIGFSEAQRSMALNAALESGQAAERVAGAAGKLDSLYSVCIQLVENMAPNVMPVVEAVQMLIDRDTTHEQRRRDLQALGATVEDIELMESFLYEKAMEVMRDGYNIRVLTIGRAEESEPRPEAKPGSLESRRVQLIELGQKGSDVDRLVADVLDSLIDQVKAGNTIPAIRIEPMPAPEAEPYGGPAGEFTADDVRASLSKMMQHHGTQIVEDSGYSWRDLVAMVEGARAVPDDIARDLGYQKSGDGVYTQKD